MRIPAGGREHGGRRASLFMEAGQLPQRGGSYQGRITTQQKKIFRLGGQGGQAYFGGVSRAELFFLNGEYDIRIIA